MYILWEITSLRTYTKYGTATAAEDSEQSEPGSMLKSNPALSVSPTLHPTWQALHSPRRLLTPNPDEPSAQIPRSRAMNPASNASQTRGPSALTLRCPARTTGSGGSLGTFHTKRLKAAGSKIPRLQWLYVTLGAIGAPNCRGTTPETPIPLEHIDFFGPGTDLEASLGCLRIKLEAKERLQTWGLRDKSSGCGPLSWLQG